MPAPITSPRERPPCPTPITPPPRAAAPRTAGPGVSHPEARAAAHREGGEPDGTRRDFIFYATGGAAAVAAGAAVWPLVNQMNPSADVRALASIQVDVSAVEPGTQLTVLWQGRPVFIRARTEEEIAAVRADDGAPDINDPEANNANLPGEAPALDENRTLAPFEGDANPPGTWLVQMGVCTHLGCVPLGDSGDFGGWFCPCHGSHYDTSGRIRKGPAPRNLPIPVAAFVDAGTIQLG